MELSGSQFGQIIILFNYQRVQVLQISHQNRCPFFWELLQIRITQSSNDPFDIVTCKGHYPDEETSKLQQCINAREHGQILLLSIGLYRSTIIL